MNLFAVSPHDERIEDLFGVFIVIFVALDVPVPRVLGTDIAVDGALRRLGGLRSAVQLVSKPLETIYLNICKFTCNSL